MSSEYSFNNPFAEYNANVMDSQTVLSYWCSPLKFTGSTTIAESDVFQDKMPLIFMGGRGTGKTMFFKYFSYKTQKEEAIKSGEKTLEFLKSKGGIGLYLRIDGADLRSFQGSELEESQWNSLFNYYFALNICKGYLEVIDDLLIDGEIEEKVIESRFIPNFVQFLGLEKSSIRNMNQLTSVIHDALRKIAAYRAQISFINVEFEPPIVFLPHELIFNTVEIIKKTVKDFKGINFVIIIDEYENFSVDQQKIVNTLLKFVKPGITFRIGMRLKGFHTFDTISKDEFIMEGRDYRKEIFENFFLKDNKKYRQFLAEVARKRLESVPDFQQRGFSSILDILGESEDLEEEAREIAKGGITHFDLLNLAEGKLIDANIDQIKYPENPLLEMLNILWVIRGNRLSDVSIIMRNFLDDTNKEDEKVKRYKENYVNKYKLALTILLASKYRKNKKYYSFNTFSFLSSGVIGSFLELCRRSFQHAFFENPDSLYLSGKISKDTQDKAARDLANFQLDNYRRIPNHGNRIANLASNLGNIFREYHKDEFVRYPETNQFYVDISIIQDEEIINAFNKAIEWTIIQMKEKSQSTKPGMEKIQLYNLNRVFSPLYNISYRTRGGVNHTIDDLPTLMNTNNFNFTLGKRKRKSTSPKKAIMNNNQIGMFDIIGGEGVD